MRLIARLISLALIANFFSAPTVSANSVAMTNGACSKSGASAKVRFLTYKCERFEGKLLWRPVENPAEIKASPQLRYLNSEFKKLAKRLDATPSFTGYRLEIEPKIERDLWTKDMKASLDVGFKLMNLFAPTPEKEIGVFLYWNDDWIKGKLPEWCKPMGAGRACGGEAMTGQTKWFAESQNHPNTNPKQYEDETQRFYIFGHFAHEANHIAQHETFRQQGDPNVYEVEPAWLREGGPEFFKILAYAYTYKTTYSFARSLYVKNIGSRCDVISLNKLGMNPENTNGCEYNNGMIAAEYLVWKNRDIASTLWFHARGARSDGMAKAFQKSYGFSISAFAKEADRYIASQTS